MPRVFLFSENHQSIESKIPHVIPREQRDRGNPFPSVSEIATSLRSSQ